MKADLWNAIQEMLDAANYAVEKLERYTDYEDDPFAQMMVPNGALSAQQCLKEAFSTLDALMGKEAKE